MSAVLAYHDATKHSPASVRSSRHELDWANQPLPFKIYTSLEPIGLPLSFESSSSSALDAIAGSRVIPDRALDLATLARLCYFSNGVTRVLRRPGGNLPFRAAACTGALYHIELYLICGDLPNLDAGVYHYAAHDNGLRCLRRGDFRHVLVSAAGTEPSVAAAPSIVACTSTFWRNAWKYQARAYRHAFWDTGTVLANLLAVASANGVSTRLALGFADDAVNRLLDVDSSREAAICLVGLGNGSAEPPEAPPFGRLGLPTQALSHELVDYPEITRAHTASCLSSAADVTAWRQAAHGSSPVPGRAADERQQASSIESVILRRGSSRRFSDDPISIGQLSEMLDVATRPIPSDVGGLGRLTDPYLIVNAVDGLDSGTYVFNRKSASLELLRPGDFRRQAAFLDLDQDLAGQAALNVYWLSHLESVQASLGNRGYRAAQLEGAIEGGKLYLAAYALDLGATGLTFYDDEVTRFFAPHAAGKSVMFLIAVGHPARRSSFL